MPYNDCAEYNSALKARGSLKVWFEKDMQWHAPLSGKRGHHRSYADTAIQCCLGFQVRLNLALRETIGLVESFITMCAQPCKAPNFSTLLLQAQRLGRESAIYAQFKGAEFAH